MDRPSIICPIAPGEIIPSHVMKMRILDDMSRKDGSALRQCLNVGARSSQFPKSVGQYVKLTAPLFATEDDVIDFHSNLPVFGLTMSACLRQTLEAKVKSGVGRGTPKYCAHNSTSEQWCAWCPSCAIADRRTYGIAHWRREHQFLGIDFCITHGDRLVTACGSCLYSHRWTRRTAFPSASCHCGRWPANKTSFADIGLAKKLFRVLRPYLRAVLSKPKEWRSIADDIGIAISLAAKEQGLASRNAGGRTRLEAHFDSVYGLDAGKSLSSRFRISAQWLGNVVRDEVASASAISSLALVAVLFDSPETLREMLHSQVANNENGWRTEARVFRGRNKFRNGDPSAAMEAKRRNRVRKDEIDDARFFASITEQLTLQLSGVAEPCRMSKSYLALKCGRTATNILKNADRYPNSSALILQSKETPDKWRRRRVTLILKNADKVRSPRGLFNYVAQSAGVSLEETRRIVEEDEELRHLLVFI